MVSDQTTLCPVLPHAEKPLIYDLCEVKPVRQKEDFPYILKPSFIYEREGVVRFVSES